MFEALCEWMMFPLYYANLGGIPYSRSGAHHAAIVPYGPYRTSDGNTVMIGIQNEREWMSFCERVLALPDLACDLRFNSNSRRVANREALASIIEPILRTVGGKQLLELLDAIGIASSRMNTLQDVWNHPQLSARERWRDFDSPVGQVAGLVPPGVPQGVEPRFDPVPALGAQVDTVLAELGYSRKEMDQLRDEQVI
jgi:crotonobetainyl-CoA:carnitine CoA-transferase CaiB-like acyl-CoA transferase